MLSLILLFNLSACGLDVYAEELSEGFSRKATEKGEINDAFVTAMANFSFDLFKGLVTKDNENDLVSPLSAGLCLAMMANGADGNTKTQMENVLGMDVDTLNKALFVYVDSLYSSKDCKVEIANSIWFKDEGFKANDEFLQTNADWFDAQIYAAPFDTRTVKDINNWCKKHTDGMIDKIMESLDKDSVMVLINALLFDAKWDEKYENKNVTDGIFNNYDESTRMLKMLSSEEDTVFVDENAIGFAKPYKEGKYSLVALLPDENTDIYDYINELNGEKWMKIWRARLEGKVNAIIPEFSYEQNMNLNEILQSLGMTDMFDPQKADFSKAGEARDNIYCSDVRQKTFIEVSRNGTKAAAITFGDMKMGFIPAEIRLDRPFVFGIVDNNTGLPLFVGAVT